MVGVAYGRLPRRRPCDVCGDRDLPCSLDQPFCAHHRPVEWDQSSRQPCGGGRRCVGCGSSMDVVPSQTLADPNKETIECSQNTTNTYTCAAWGNPVSKSGALESPRAHEQHLRPRRQFQRPLRRPGAVLRSVGRRRRPLPVPGLMDDGHACAGDRPTNSVDCHRGPRVGCVQCYVKEP